MPRGSRISTEQQNTVLVTLNTLFSSTASFSPNIVGEDWLTSIRAFRPKQFQVDYFVNRTTLPNALIQLFLDVSPAMVSIVGTERDVYRNTMMGDAYDRVNSEFNGNVARNMAYALASFGEIGNSQNNVPNFRKPSGMPDGNWDILKNKIEDGIRSGEQSFMDREEGEVVGLSAMGYSPEEIAEAQEEQARINEQIESGRAQEQGQSGTYQDALNEVCFGNWDRVTFGRLEVEKIRIWKEVGGEKGVVKVEFKSDDTTSWGSLDGNHFRQILEASVNLRDDRNADVESWNNTIFSFANDGQDKSLMFFRSREAGENQSIVNDGYFIANVSQIGTEIIWSASPLTELAPPPPNTTEVVEEVEGINYNELPIVANASVPITPESLNMPVEGVLRTPNFERAWYGKLRVAQALSFGGWDVTSIRRFFARIEDRGFTPYEIASRRGGYIVVRVKSTNNNPRRFQSSTLNEFVYSSTSFNTANDFRTTIRDFYITGTGRNLRSVSFSGRGGFMRGILAIPTPDSVILSDIPTISELETRYSEAFNTSADVEGEATETTPQSTPTPSGGGGIGAYDLIYLGLMVAPSGQLYGATHNLNRNLMLSFSASERDYVSVFYFASWTGGEIEVYQLQWGNVRDYSVNNLSELQAYFKNNVRLGSPENIQLYEITDVAVQNALLSQDNESFEVRWRQSDFRRFSLGEGEFTIVKRGSAFNDAIASRVAEVEQRRTAEGVSLTTRQLKAIGKKSLDKIFGVEIEGNFDETSKGTVARKITEAGIPTNSTHYHGSAPDGYWKLEDDSSVTNDFAGNDSKVFEAVSPKLDGESGVLVLKKFLKLLRENGARTSPSAGTHIHLSYQYLGTGDSGLLNRKRMLVNYLVLQPFLIETQIAQSRNRYYATTLKNITPENIRKIVDAPDWATVSNIWRKRESEGGFGGGRNALNITNESTHELGRKSGRVPTYEFRFPASNFEDDTITNMVRMLEKILSASMKGYLPHSRDEVKPRVAEEWLEDLFGQELYSFWKNRYRDVQSTEAYVEARRTSYSDIQDEDGATVVSNKLIPTLNWW